MEIKKNFLKRSLAVLMSAAFVVTSIPGAAFMMKAAESADTESVYTKSIYSPVYESHFGDQTLESTVANTTLIPLNRNNTTYTGVIDYTDGVSHGKDTYGLLLVAPIKDDTYTVSCKVKLDELQNDWGGLVWIGESGNRNDFLALGRKGNSTNEIWGALGNGQRNPVVENVIAAGETAHITIVVNGTRLTAYKDGIEIVDTLIDFVPSSEKGLDIMFGCNRWEDSVYGGSVNDIRVYDEALDARQAKALYDTGVAVTPENSQLKVGNQLQLDAFVVGATENASLTWTSSDESIATVADGVVTGIKEGDAIITATAAEGDVVIGQPGSAHVTVTGDDVTSALKPMYQFDFEDSLKEAGEGFSAKDVVVGFGDYAGEPQYAEGRTGKALKLDGQYGVDLLSNAAAKPEGSYTVSMWANVQAAEDGMGGGNHWASSLFFSGTQNTWISIARERTWTSPNGQTVVHNNKEGVWTHYLLSVDENEGKAYVYKNGSPEATCSVASGTLSGQGAVTAIGTNWWDPNNVGLVDDVKIYAGALNANQIDAVYNEGISIVEDAVELEVNQTYRLNTLNISGAEGAVLEWSTSDAGVATVENGVVTAVSSGSAEVTVSLKDGENIISQDTVSVTVLDAELKSAVISLAAEEDGILEIEETTTLTSEIAPDNAGTLTYNWTSSNAEVASVEDGVITAKSAGTADIVLNVSNNKNGVTSNVITITVIDKTALKTLIDSAYTIASRYTADSWTGYTDALDKAKVVSDSKAVTQEEINAAVLALQSAEDALQINPSVIADFNFDDDTAGFAGAGAVANKKGNIQLVDHEGGKALNLTGDASWLDIKNNDGTPLLSGLNEFTVSYDCYSQAEQFVYWTFYASHNDLPTVNAGYIGIADYPDHIDVLKYDTGAWTGNVLTPNEWRHIDVVFAEGKTQVYVDQKLITENDCSGSLKEKLGRNSIAYIGRANWDNGKGEFFKGQLDNFKIYNYALDEAGIKEPQVSEIIVNNAPENPIQLGSEPVELSITIKPDNAVNKKVTWATSDENVATVDAKGVVTAVGKGTADITITPMNGTADSVKTITITVVDNTALTTAISAANEKKQEDYSVESWNAMQTALKEAQTVAEDPAATQAEIDAAATALNDAVNALTVDRTALQAAVNEVNTAGYMEVNYTQETWAALTAALQTAEGLLTAETVTQTQIDAAEQALASAVTGLAEAEVDKSELETLIASVPAEAEKVNYTETSWAALQTALTEAKSVAENENAKNSDVIAAKDTLRTAINGLELIAADKTELQNAVDAALGDDKADYYTNSSWAAYQEALSAARTVLQKDAPTQKEVNDAAAGLAAATSNLVKIEVSKTTLAQLVDGKLNDTEAVNYTPESWNAYQNAIAAAQQVLNNEDATQKMVNDAETALRIAYGELVGATADKSALTQALSEAPGEKEQSKYTPDSWNAYWPVYVEATNILTKTDARQSEVNEAVQKLNAAVGALVKIVVSKTELNGAIAEAETYVAENYSEESYASLTKALEDARTVANNPDAAQVDVDAATAALTAAIAALTVDRTGLQSVIASAPAADKETDYTADSWSAYQSALTAAVAVVNKADATQKEINNAKAALEAAISSLATDKTALEAAIGRKPADPENHYSTDSWGTYQSALANAVAVCENNLATQSQINAAVAELRNALEALVVVHDYVVSLWRWLPTENGYIVTLNVECSVCHELKTDLPATVTRTDAGNRTTYTALVEYNGKTYSAIKEVINGYNLTVENGSALAGADKTYHYGELVSVKAEETITDKDNQVKYFAGWYVGETKVSDKLVYSFYIYSDVVLEARYGEHVLEAKPVVSLTMSDRQVTNEAGSQKVTITLQWSEPSGFTFIEAGIVRSYTDNTPTLEEVDGVKVRQNINPSPGLNGSYRLNLNMSATTAKNPVYAVGYLKYRDSAGNEHTIYSNDGTALISNPLS